MSDKKSNTIEEQIMKNNLYAEQFNIFVIENKLESTTSIFLKKIWIYANKGRYETLQNGRKIQNSLLLINISVLI
jgi:hypothetical protein